MHKFKIARQKVISIIVNFALYNTKSVFAFAVVLTFLSLIASTFLTLDVRWTTLLPEKLPVAEEFRYIDDNFLQPGNMIIVISGNDENILAEIADEAAYIIERDMQASPEMTHEEIKNSRRYVKYAYHKMPEEWLIQNGLRIISPKDVERVSNIFSVTTLVGLLKNINDDFENEYTDSDSIRTDENRINSSLSGLEYFIKTVYDVAIGNPPDEKTAKKVARMIALGDMYNYSLDRKTLLMMVASSVSSDDAEAMIGIDYRIEEVLLPLQEKYPDYKIERTGLSAVSRDEMDSVGPYTIAITMIALLIVYVLLTWNFKSFTIPLLNMIPVVAGIIWSMGFIAITLGELNLVTSMMMVVLLGLGIDFTIHISSRYFEELNKSGDIKSSLEKMLGNTGKGVVTGALTTSAAFLALMIAKTPVVFEFGFCAGFGLIITLLASFILMPALLVAKSKKILKKKKAFKVISDIPFLGIVPVFTNRHFKKVIIISILFFVSGIFATRSIEWEWNFLELEPEGLRSVELYDEIVDKFKFSITTSMVTVDSVDKSRKLRDKFLDLPQVIEVDDVSAWVSRNDLHESLPHIIKLRDSIDFETINFNTEHERENFAYELDRLWANLVEIQGLAFTGGQDRVFEKLSYIIGTRETRDDAILRVVADMYESDDYDVEVMNHFSHAFSFSLFEILQKMTYQTSPVTIECIPEKELARYISLDSEKYLMHIIPGQNLFTKQGLVDFQNAISTSAPNVTGVPQLILAMNVETLREGRVAVILSAVVISILLLIDFKNPLVALVTFLPVVGSFCTLFLIMVVTGEKMNYINVIALPIILGIGIDDGVHFMHRYLEEGHDNIKKAVYGSGRAMLMTSLTTMAGFGSLMFYLMQGLASLGFVLFFGVGFCFIITITLLPALMHYIHSKNNNI